MGRRKIMKDDISSAPAHITDNIILSDSTAQAIEIERREAAEKDKQNKIEDYNATVGDIDERFAQRTYTFGFIIVKLLKEDYILEVENSALGSFAVRKTNKVPFGVQDTGSQLDSNMIDNPLPYMSEGVIQVVPEHLKKNYKETTGIELKPGMKVQVSIPEMMNAIPRLYYFDKTRTDVNQTDEDFIGGNAFSNHEGYFLIYPNEIESFTNE